jgi:anti-sigma regulatory factor (Ser/Thr protein kinase)
VSPGPPLESVGTSLETSVEARPEQLTALRREVRALASRAGVPTAVRSDLELVVSELATNVIRHTRAPSMKVSVAVEPGDGCQEWTVCVENEVVPIPLDGDPVIETPLGGRGLRIVATIMDGISVTETDGRMTIQATRTVTL